MYAFCNASEQKEKGAVFSFLTNQARMSLI